MTFISPRGLVLAAVVLPFLLVAGCATSSNTTDAMSTDAATTQPAADAPIQADSATLVVFGMSCPQCANNIDLQLLRIPGVKGTTTDLGTGDVTVQLTPGMVTREQLASAINESSYTLKDIRVP